MPIPRKRTSRKPPPSVHDFLELEPPAGGKRPRAGDLLGEDLEPGEWTPVSGMVFGCMTVCFFYMVYLLAGSNAITGESFVLMMLHSVNLVFHEFGHPAFSFFGDTMGILGGTLGQILIPLVVAVAFWKKRDSAGFFFGAFWFFENFLDVAVYMADAIDLKLQLIGGLGMEAHDWRNLFLRWDCILQAKTIAGITAGIGWVGMFWAWLWLGWRCLMTRNKRLSKIS